MNFALVVLAVLLTAGCGAGRASDLNSVQLGMTKEEVITIMGPPMSISAEPGVEYLNYSLARVVGSINYGRGPYYVRLRNGKVDSFGGLGDFDSTQKPNVRVETGEDIKANVSEKADLYSELKKLKELRDEGIISETEFEKEKKELLEKY